MCSLDRTCLCMGSFRSTGRSIAAHIIWRPTSGQFSQSATFVMALCVCSRRGGEGAMVVAFVHQFLAEGYSPSQLRRVHVQFDANNVEPLAA
jgi:hypothetical protein